MSKVGVGIRGGTDALIASDEIAGKQFQRSKITIGDIGTDGGDVSATNPMPAAITQTVIASTTNNSTANLAASASFTGTGESTLSAAAIQLMFYADQDCTITIDQNDTNVWSSPKYIRDTYKFVVAKGARGFTVQAISAYFRVVVTNDSATTATTYLNLQCVLCPIAVALPSSLDLRGYLKVGGADFGLDVQRGIVSGISFTNKFGRNQATAAGEAIWALSSAYVAPPTAQVMSVVSADTNDAAAGTGARTISITGIDDSYDIVTETLTLNGTTAVLTTNKYWNLHHSYVLTAGSGATAAGNITFTSTAAGTPAMGLILVGYNQTQSTVYMVPRLNTAYINMFELTAQAGASNATIDIGFFKQEFGGVFRIQNDSLFREANTSYMSKEFGAPLKCEAKSTIMFKVIAQSSAHDVAVDYDLWLVADSAV